MKNHLKKSLLVKENLKKTNIPYYLLNDYHKIYFLTKKWEWERVKNNKFVYLEYNTENDFKKLIKEAVHNNNKEYIIPYFQGDKYSKYSIFVQNLYWKEIDWKLFKHKNIMNKFIWWDKKNIKLSREQLKTISYDDIINQLWVSNWQFIIKPTNWSSSMWTFKVISNDNWLEIQKKILASDWYVVEEYLWWSLYSLDFLFTWEEMLILTLVKETPFIEFIEEWVLSDNFMNKYWTDINKHFLYFLPIRYNVKISSISKTELTFFQDIINKLKITWYKWIIHLEYKYDKKNNSIWFIEWWARQWWKRSYFVEKINYFDMKNLILDSYNWDITKWKNIHKSIFAFKDTIKDNNIVGIKTNVLKKTPMFKILDKYNYLKSSFNEFIFSYFSKKWIVIKKNVDFTVKTTEWWQLMPFYESNETRFDYLIEMNDENFKKFKKKKIEILENLVFHDY